MVVQAEDFVGAVASYAKLFARCRRLNISHPQLYVCHANRAAAFLRLGLYDEALQDAERARSLAEASFKRQATTSLFKLLDPILLMVQCMAASAASAA